MSMAMAMARLSELVMPVLGITPPVTVKKLDFFRLNNSYSIERSQRELRWKPRITFEQGAEEIAAVLNARSTGAQ